MIQPPVVVPPAVEPPVVQPPVVGPPVVQPFGGPGPYVSLSEAEGEGSDQPSAAHGRDDAAHQRDHAGDQRDNAAHQRDEAGDERDEAGQRRDQAGDERDETGYKRDNAAEQRDQAAEQRDQAAERSEASATAGEARDALNRSALARREAASDRNIASQDRRAAASERTQAELDRNTALADRGSAASERTQAELDRITALADRGASATERECASVDDLTGAYLRGVGLVQLKFEMSRSRRAQRPLVVAFVGVDRITAVDDPRRSGAGERMLVEVANTLRSELRSFDLVIRYADHAFLCAISGVDMAGARKLLALVSTALGDAPEHGSVAVGLAELQPDDSPEDLVARAGAALYRERQRQGGHVETGVWRYADLVVDERTHSVARASSPVRLTATEFKMLGVLVRNCTRVVPRVELLDKVWGHEADDHLLEVHMSCLRRKLEAHGPRVIQTIRGMGYVLGPEGG